MGNGGFGQAWTLSGTYDDSILRSLRRITRAIDLHSRKLAREYKLTGPQLVCLLQLSQHGRMTPSKLAAEVALSNATVSGILDRLEVRSLVVRERSTTDKRRVNVRLTDAGHQLVSDAPTPLQRRFSRRLAALPQAEQDAIDATLQRIVEMMEAEELDAAPMLAAGPMTAEPSEVVEFLEPAPTDPESQDDGGRG